MKRSLVWLGALIALALAAATLIDTAKHPPLVDQSDYPHDRANPWGPPR